MTGRQLGCLTQQPCSSWWAGDCRVIGIMGPKPPKQEKRLSAAQLVHPFSWERERKELPHGLHRLELSDILICDIAIVQAGKCKNPTFFPNFSNFGLGRQRPALSPFAHEACIQHSSKHFRMRTSWVLATTQASQVHLGYNGPGPKRSTKAEPKTAF